MSETLSNMIAFVGFLILLSMIVQTFQESLKDLLKLKTGVWERFFMSLYRREFGTAGEKPEGGVTDQRGIAASFNALKTRVRSDNFVGEFEKRLQRIKEIVCNADGLLRTIRQGITDVLVIDADAPDAGTKLAQTVAPLVEKGVELSSLRLHDILEIYDSLQGKKFKLFQSELVKFIEERTDLTERLRSLEREKTKELVRTTQQYAAELQKELDAVARMLVQYRVQIENKLDAWIAQLNEEYRRNMLLWTIMIGTALVFLFNADSFEIYKYLSANPAAQAGVVQAVAGMKDAKYLTDAADLNSAETQLREGKTAEAKTSLVHTAKNLKEDFAMLDDKQRIASVTLLEKRLQEVPQKDKDASFQQLKEISGELSLLYLSFQKAVVDHHIERLTYLDLPLGWADDYHTFTSGAGNRWRLLFRKLGGLFLTSFLITFGAPFWNDVLNAVVGLKNIGAKK